MSIQTAVFGGGCFWCTEAVFKNLRGVQSVMPGYAGGQAKEEPSYEEVSGGTTGHAEVIKIDFDLDQITFRDLLEVFFATHDPTTLNRQGADVGTQYRSTILYTSNEQKSDAEKFIAELVEQKVYDEPIVTTIEPLEHFYEAEDYHRDYYAKHPYQGYCQIVINPKVDKLKKKFASLLKTT